MSNTTRRVYVQGTPRDSLVQIQPEYVYMRIPADYICIYHKILVMFADFGIELLDDCTSSCKDRNKNLINCFNMLNAAIAARQLGNLKLAELLIKYIEGQINIQYNGDAPCPDIVYPVDANGKIMAMVGCGEKPTFWVDAETGKLIQDSSEDIQGVYVLGDNDKDSNV